MKAREIFCIVRLAVPAGVSHHDALASVRECVSVVEGSNDSLGINGVRLVSVSPIPASRYIKPRRPPTKKEPAPLRAYLEKQT